jgi:hypothetical protein
VSTNGISASAWRSAPVAALFAMALALPATALAWGPSPEYGPEAEAQFLDRCVDQTGADLRACRCFAETLQDGLGYEDFLELAAYGPIDPRLSLEPRETAALRRAVGQCLAPPRTREASSGR